MDILDVLPDYDAFTERGLEPKAIKQCGYQYMGPRFYCAPKKSEWDYENGICTDEVRFMRYELITIS